MAKYLIAVGGTGMRCLESFIHLCAVGMMDNEEINVLIIDTDHDNGNKSQTHNLISLYQTIKKDKGGNGVPLKDSFFSASINFYDFIPTYKPPTNTFDRIRNKEKSEDAIENELNEDLANLFFEDETQDFDLEHGYRAQTHLGSYLMYNGIIDEIKSGKQGNKIGTVKKNGLSSFVQLLGRDNEAKVFILGSIFGGTGASSIPIIPRALRQASEVLGISLNDVIFGSTLLSEYFTFDYPDDEQMSKQKIIAKANTFRLNSQAALMYYDTNDTVKKDYQHFYMLGWPQDATDYTASEGKGEVATGGNQQLNPAHILELLSGFAAYHFFKSVNSYNEKTHEWYFKSVEQNDSKKLRFDFSDLIGTKDAKKFKQKLTAFFSMCFMLKNEYKKYDPKEALLLFYNVINQGKIKGEISIEESEALSRYIDYFAFSYNHTDNRVVPGWLFQVRKSTKSTSFLFEEFAFSESYKDLLGIEWANILPNHHFAKKNRVLTWKNTSFDTLSQTMKENTTTNFKGMVKPNEMLLKWVYDTYCQLLKVM